MVPVLEPPFAAKATAKPPLTYRFKLVSRTVKVKVRAEPDETEAAETLTTDAARDSCGCCIGGGVGVGVGVGVSVGIAVVVCVAGATLIAAADVVPWLTAVFNLPSTGAVEAASCSGLL